MRKLVTAAASVLFLFAVQPADAQTIGFKLGPTWSSMDADPDDGGEQDKLTSVGGGGFVRFGMAGLSLQAELLALTKGTAVSENDPEFGDVEGKLKLNYIEVPVTAMFSLGNGPYIFGGPSVAFETGCEIEFEIEELGEISGNCDDEDSGEEFTPARKKVDLGVVAGAGVQFRMGPGSILIEGRHTWGLSNLNDDPNQDGKIRNRSLAIFAGYAIPIGR